MGTHLAKMLSRENHDIVVIDSDVDRLKNLATTSDLLIIKGDVTSKRILTEAGVNEADLFIAVTPWDDTNFLSAIVAKKLGAKFTVARVSRSEPMGKESRDIFTGLGIDSFVYPEKIAAREIVNTLRQSGVSMLVEFSGGRLILLAVKINKDAPIVNKTPKEVTDTYHIDYCTVAIQRNGKTIIPYGDIRYESDDTVYIVTNYSNTKDILRYSGRKQEHIAQVMILGGSHIGRLVAKELGNDFKTKLFEADRDEAYRLSDLLNNVLVIHGDNTNIDLLIEEGLRTTDAFVAVTGNSEDNILACLLAKSEGVKHTVAEIENLNYISLAERLGINVIINKKHIAAGHIYRHTLSGSISKIKHLATTEAEALEFVAPLKSKITERPICELKFPKNAIIGGLVRNNTGFIAKGDTWIQPGDRVVVFSMPAAVGEVSKFFK